MPRTQQSKKRPAENPHPELTPQLDSKPPTKADLILAYAKSHKEAKPREIVTALAAMGVTTTTPYVSTTLSTNKRRRGQGKRSQRTIKSFADLLNVKRFVDRIGGVEPARNALDTLAAVLA